MIWIQYLLSLLKLFILPLMIPGTSLDFGECTNWYHIKFMSTHLKWALGSAYNYSISQYVTVYFTSSLIPLFSVSHCLLCHHIWKLRNSYIQNMQTPTNSITTFTNRVWAIITSHLNYYNTKYSLFSKM